jgi:hypothetical protein
MTNQKPRPNRVGAVGAALAEAMGPEKFAEFKRDSRRQAKRTQRWQPSRLQRKAAARAMERVARAAALKGLELGEWTPRKVAA